MIKSFMQALYNNPQMDHTEKHSSNHHNLDKIVRILKKMKNNNNIQGKTNIDKYKNRQILKLK